MTPRFSVVYGLALWGAWLGSMWIRRALLETGVYQGGRVVRKHVYLPWTLSGRPTCVAGYVREVGQQW